MRILINLVKKMDELFQYIYRNTNNSLRLGQMRENNSNAIFAVHFH